MPDIAYMNPAYLYASQLSRHPLIQAEVESLDMYDLPGADLTQYHGLIIPPAVDQELLYREREKVRSFLDDGKVLVFCGHLFRDWLPGAGPYVPKGVNADSSRLVPKGIHSSQEYNVRVAAPHPIFEGVLPEDLTFRKGVRGFFAHGHHPTPEGAQILLTLESGETIDYIDRRSTGGVILVHSGNDLLGYVDSDNSARLLVPQLFGWIHHAYSALQTGRSST